MEIVITLLFLVFLEGILSFDNALALAAMVKPLPEHLQKKALTYGILGAFLFRFIALFFVTQLMANPFIKVIGGLYLIYIAFKALTSTSDEGEGGQLSATMNFIKVLVMVELTDIAFSIDSILVAAAMTNKLWIIVTGGILGIIMMRYASTIFIKLIDKFPRLETTAFQLVGLAGLKLLLEIPTEYYALDFHKATNPEAWVAWVLMAGSMFYGFSERSNEVVSSKI